MLKNFFLLLGIFFNVFYSYSQTDIKVQIPDKKFKYSSQGITEKALEMYVPTKEIEINCHTGTAKESIPYDQYIYFKIERQEEDTLKWYGYCLYKSASGNDICKLLQNPRIIHFCESSKYYVYFLIPPLKANKSYKLHLEWEKQDSSFSQEFNISTLTFNAHERAKAILSPEFGYSAIWFKNLDNSLFVNHSLVFVVNYNFVPVNKDIPLNKIYKPLDKRRFSVLMGITLNSIAEEGMREDLFGNNNLLLGIGWRPFDQIRLSYGAVFFTEVNPNKLLTHQKSFAYTSFTSITIDLDIKDLLGGIVTTLGLK